MNEKTLSDKPVGFNMADFEAIPNDSGITLVRKIVTIPVRKPDKQKFFRTHPTSEVLVHLVEIKEEGEYYLVRKSALQALVGETKLFRLHLCYYQNGTIFLCPIPQPDEDGKWNQWHKSLAIAIVDAKKKWIRAIPDKSINGYTIIEANGQISEPEIPRMSLEEILQIAFKDRIIDNENHPIVKKLMGS